MVVSGEGLVGDGKVLAADIMKWLSFKLSEKGRAELLPWILGGECPIRQVAGDPKVRGAVESVEGQEALQKALDGLERWAILAA